MQILARYIALSFLKNLLLSLFGLLGLYFVQSIITQVNDYPLIQVLIYNVYEIPKMFVIVSPPSALLATILTLSALSRSSELVAMFSIGISMQQIMGIIFPVVFVFCCASLVIQDRILPAFHDRQALFYWREMKQRRDFFLDVRQEKVWYRSGQAIYNLAAFDPKTERIQGLGFYEFTPDFELKRFIQGEYATHEGQGWRVFQGKETEFDPQDQFPKVKAFDAMSVSIKETPKDFKLIENEVDRLRIKELMRFITVNKKSGIDTKAYETKFHSRFSMSFIPLIMCLLAFPFSVSRNREGRLAKDLAIALGLTFLYWLAFSLGLSMGQKGTLPPWLAAWLPSMIFSALALYLVAKPNR